MRVSSSQHSQTPSLFIVGCDARGTSMLLSHSPLTIVFALQGGHGGSGIRSVLFQTRRRCQPVAVRGDAQFRHPPHISLGSTGRRPRSQTGLPLFFPPSPLQTYINPSRLVRDPSPRLTSPSNPNITSSHLHHYPIMSYSLEKTSSSAALAMCGSPSPFSPSISFPSDSHLLRARPFSNSYWATPLLVACEYPWTPTQANRSQKIDMLLRAGVRTFIDLTEDGELSPYAPHLAAHVARLGIDRAEVEYHSFPIPDRCLPRSVAYVRQILAVLKDNARRGRISAVHCRGGIGRTGLVVGCWLVESGAVEDGAAALRFIAEEWKSVEKYGRYPQSPETGGQCEFVRSFERQPGSFLMPVST